MAYDRYKSYQGSSSRSRCGRRKLGCEPHKRGLNTKLHMAVDSHGMPIRFFITKGTESDFKKAEDLMNGVDADYLLADRGYDSDAIVNKAES